MLALGFAHRLQARKLVFKNKLRRTVKRRGPKLKPPIYNKFGRSINKKYAEINRASSSPRPEEEEADDPIEPDGATLPKEGSVLTGKVVSSRGKKNVRKEGEKRKMSIRTAAKKITSVLVREAAHKYASQKVVQFARRQNINAFLSSLEIVMMANADNIQAQVEYNLRLARGAAESTLLPLEFQLFHTPVTSARELLREAPEYRAKFCLDVLSRAKEDLDMFSSSLFQETKKNCGKETLDAIYSRMLGTENDVQECSRLLNAELYSQLRLKKMPQATDEAVLRSLFECRTGPKVPLPILLDFKEYAKMRRMYEMLRIINELINYQQ